MPRTLSQKGKVVKIAFVSDPAFKRLVEMALADKQMSLKDAGHAALAKYLKIPVAGQENSSAAA